jgi:galactoside 2-L-fucosyltransferase 1/2
MIQELGKIFRNLPVPALSYLAYCPVKKYPVSVTAEEVHHSHESILLPDYAQLSLYIATLVSEVRHRFQFKEHIVDESQRLLHNALKGVNDITYVGVHVRRTDYNKHLKSLYNASMVKPDFFLRQMNVLRNKYKPIMFE